MHPVPARWGLPVLAVLCWSGAALAQGLSGTVRSAEDGPMGGVLVNARAAGSTITVTVVTDSEGASPSPPGGWRRGRPNSRSAPPAGTWPGRRRSR
ncbi:carboxypeptidase-like regulatory domain-containing protein [Dankookia sp. P2]|uniref:carboxypeptidase-like regulatory domain-containing protein n=1 Tax=Dankookia sp. P2 TaxID=3423955 RepID=UPI003D671BD4